LEAGLDDFQGFQSQALSVRENVMKEGMRSNEPTLTDIACKRVAGN